jgi:hypothetical protein
MVWGLDMRFLGGKREKKNKGRSKGNEISRFAPSTALGLRSGVKPRLRLSGDAFRRGFLQHG